MWTGKERRVGNLPPVADVKWGSSQAARLWYVCSRCTEREKVVVFIRKDDGMVVSPAFLKTPGDILEAALVRERNAHTFYSEALKHAGSGPVRELLEQLRDSEYMHMQSIKKKMAEMQLG